MYILYPYLILQKQVVLVDYDSFHLNSPAIIEKSVFIIRECFIFNIKYRDDFILLYCYSKNLTFQIKYVNKQKKEPHLRLNRLKEKSIKKCQKQHRNRFFF
jgi:hypothetical protein